MSEYSLEDMLQALQEQLGEKMEVSSDSFFTFLRVAPGEVLGLAKNLRENYGFNHLANLSSVDYGETFEIVYHIYSIPENDKIAIKTSVPRNKAEIDSVFSVWPTADWQEREVYDLMGIKFKKHPNLIRVLLPDDFEGHPLRKDFKMEGR
ncbi:MAG: NADH-quinone oxidoreductase subunit C [Bacillota bacterium]|nr:NADH-quinone oxidoreductase subunit C [Bacillota bacterium]